MGLWLTFSGPHTKISGLFMTSSSGTYLLIQDFSGPENQKINFGTFRDMWDLRLVLRNSSPCSLPISLLTNETDRK